ncbi:hypothetical protein M569_06833 [Genlisea aurea]|uniref:Uncharacterized protein n=1 Tax=Genlisea aurea TaxID=192259 RepID=S8CMJ4_9LAMI|nr:hypothetical protein M569_06833 [Genlisea aurea]
MLVTYRVKGAGNDVFNSVRYDRKVTERDYIFTFIVPGLTNEFLTAKAQYGDSVKIFWKSTNSAKEFDGEIKPPKDARANDFTVVVSDGAMTVTSPSFLSFGTVMVRTPCFITANSPHSVILEVRYDGMDVLLHGRSSQIFLRLSTMLFSAVSLRS